MIGSLVAVALGAYLTPAGEKAFDATGDVLDGVRDALLRSPDGRSVDNLKEYIEGLDDWVDEPQLFDGSFSYLTDHGDLDLVRAEGPKFDSLTVSALVEEAPEYEGTPVFLVGRVVDRRSRSTDDFSTFSSSELLLSDVSNEDFAYVGLGGTVGSDDPADKGDVVVVRGLVMASGLAEYEGSTPFRTAYFTSQELTRPGFGARFHGRPGRDVAAFKQR